MKYSLFFIIPLTGYVALVSQDFGALVLILLTFVLIPLLELLLKGTPKQLSKELEQQLTGQKLYDMMLYLVAPIQYSLLFLFLYQVSEETSPILLATKTVSMGILCGVLGINVAHELGHRRKTYEQIIAQSLLLTSLYMHFFIEHNRGHHKKVATPEDPATGRYGESVYRFLIRCIPEVFISAWQLEKQRLNRMGTSIWSWSNQMIRFLSIEMAFCVSIWVIFGFKSFILFVLAATLGFILLECIDYIEHYGLLRKQIKPGIYEAVQAKHSWNCNQLLGRVLLFELPLHPAHHKNSSLPYQVLQSEGQSPQMPLGYPGMIILSLIPALWFKKINPIVQNAMNQ